MRKLLYFHAPWCPPCRFYEKEFIRPLEARAGPASICRINAQGDPFTAEKYMVDKLPTVVFLDGETAVKQATGGIDIEDALRFLEGGGDG